MGPQEMMELFNYTPDFQFCFFQALMMMVQGVGTSAAAGGVGTAAGGVGTAAGGVGTAAGGVGTAAGGVGTAAGGVGTAAGGTGAAGYGSMLGAAGAAAEGSAGAAGANTISGFSPTLNAGATSVGAGTTGGTAITGGAGPLSATAAGADVGLAASTGEQTAVSGATQTPTLPTTAPPSIIPPPTTGTSPLQTPNPPAIETLLKPNVQMTPVPTTPTLGPAPTMSTPTGPVTMPTPSKLPGGRVIPPGKPTPVGDFFNDMKKALGFTDPKTGKPYKHTKRSKKMSEVLETIGKANKVKKQFEDLGSGVPEARSELLPTYEQATPSAPAFQVPQIERAQTTDLGLARGGEKEAPLSFDQLQNMQGSSILDLVSQLRTQRRLFG